MPADPYLPGYLVYLCEVFVPGIGVAELLNAWREKSGLAERVAFAFGLGIAVDTLVLVVRTSGLTVLGARLAGIDTATIGLIIAIGLVAFAASLVWRRRLLFPVRPVAADLVVAALVVTLGSIVALFFQKYPIFPQYQSPDYATHVEVAQGLLSGTTVSIPDGILYYGVHLQLASALLLVGGEGLVTVQRTMGLLVTLSPLLVYAASARIFSSSGAGLVATALYTLSGTVWSDSVFNSGLYANFFGTLACLFFLVAIVWLSESVGSPRRWIVFVLALVLAYFSHFTTVTLLPALILVPIIQLIRTKDRKGAKRFLVPSLVSVAPGGLALLVAPHLAPLILSLATTGGGALSGGTTLSAALGSIPFLGYIALEVYSDIAFVFLFVFAAVYVYRGAVGKSALLFIPLLWFFSLFLAAPNDLSAWRFSYEAIFPLTLMAGYGIFSLLPKLPFAPSSSVAAARRRKGKRTATGYSRGYDRVILVLGLLLLPVVAVSWGTSTVSDSLSGTQFFAQTQQNVYTAMYWLKDNTPANSSYLSVSDWRVTYTDLFFGRPTTYAFMNNPDASVAYADKIGAGYIVVTNLVTVSLPPIPQDYPWNNFKPSANLTLIYSNSDVEVFRVA